jgi:Flp pilus assembly protein TadD
MVCSVKNVSKEIAVFTKRIELRGSKRLLFFLWMIALIPQGNSFAQQCIIDKVPDEYVWSRPETRDPIYWRFYEEGAEFNVRQPVEHTPRTSIVTLHQLSHRVPRHAAKEYDRAVKAKEKGDQENAIAHFNRAIAIDPEFFDAINDLGVLYLDGGRTDQAIERFTKAVAVDPHAALPYLNLALAYLRQHQLVDGERAARQAMDLDRGDPYGPLVLGILLVLEGKFTAEAESSLERAARDFECAKLWLAVGLVERGNIAKAKRELRTYIAHAKDNEVGIAGALLNRLESDGQNY